MWQVASSAVLMCGVVLYALGASRYWQRAGYSRGITLRHVLMFGSAALLSQAVLGWPFGDAAHERFYAHMAQHVIVIEVVALIAAAGNPTLAFIFAVPSSVTRGVARGLRPARRLWQRHGMLSWLLPVLYVAMVWAWHMPGLYDVAQLSAPVHFAEHASLLTIAVLFWRGVIRDASRSTSRKVQAIMKLTAVMLATMPLGVFLTFATVGMYESHAVARTAVQLVYDQQLGGLVMLMAGGLIYAAVIIWLTWRVFDAQEARAVAVAPGRRSPDPVLYGHVVLLTAEDKPVEELKARERQSN